MAIDPTTARPMNQPMAPNPAVARVPVAEPKVTSPAGDDYAWMRGGDQMNQHAAQSNDDMSFWDFLDVVNPLQHIPIVSTAYRALTGDEIKPSSKVMGDILYGGVIGGIVSIANAALEEETGKDISGHMMAAVGLGDESAPRNNRMTASATPPAGLISPTNPHNPAMPASAQDGGRSAAMARTRSAPPPTGGAPAEPSAAMAALTGGLANGAPTNGAPTNGVDGAISAAMARAPNNGQRLSGREMAEETARAIRASGHVPSQMPKRDAMVTTSMPRGAIGAPVASAMAPVKTDTGAPTTATTSQTGAPQQAPAALTANGQGARDSMAEIMLRNLDKYRDSHRAKNQPTLRTSS